MRLPVAGALLTLLISAGATAEEEVTFGYSGATGPAHWAELSPDWTACGEGKRQSPVSLDGAATADLAPLRFGYRRSPVTITDTGHTISFTPPAGNTLRVGERPVNTLLQLHFHARSEHRLDDRWHPVELHFVHADAAGRLTVAGVLVRQGAGNPAFAALLRDLPQEEGETVTSVLDPGALLPSGRASVRYSGSLTTPPCTEGVRWIVLTTPITLSGQQIDRLRASYAGNHRPLQPLGTRSLQASG